MSNFFDEQQRPKNMTIIYDEALSILQRVANDLNERGEHIEQVPLIESLGRIAGRPHICPATTPPFDTSAMDGYAIPSAATLSASEENPAVFTIKGTMAAGDEPIVLPIEHSDEALPCVEIMTGARFPSSTEGPSLDTCVKIEDTFPIPETPTSKQQIKVVRPVRPNANRRFAGSDLKEGDLLLEKGEIIRPRHIMALASVGITDAIIRRRPRIAVWSTGNELLRGSSDARSPSQIKDANGPFLIAALREIGLTADFKGILEDNSESFSRVLNEERERKESDVILTTGAVSKGKFDFVAPMLKAMRADIQFHGVAIRPGHPVLFAQLPCHGGYRPFFGLPGNPVATAACFQFLVLPFIRHVLGLEQLQPYPAKVEWPKGFLDLSACCPYHLDSFRHGFLHKNDRGENVVALSEEQSPAKVSYFAKSGCWVHIPKRQTGNDLELIAYCYPHSMESFS